MEFISGDSEIDNTGDSEYNLCIGVLIVWLMIILIFTPLFYKYTVRDLDRGNYKVAKNWTLIGIIVGFAGGIIPLIIFIVSYASFDGALRTQQYGQMQYGYQPYPTPNRYCSECKKQIPPDSRLCPYCGAHQDGKDQSSEEVPPPRLIRSTSGQKSKPLSPPESHKKKDEL
jgi:hypothetical protein